LENKKLPKKCLERLWRYGRYCLMVLGFFLMSPQQAEASHLAGADIEYQCLGQNQYRITIRLYRDCAGISMPTQLNLAINSASCGATFGGQVLPRDTFYEVSQLCPGVISQSACNNGSLPGYQVHVYSDIITFPQTCSDWTVGWSTCCRNGAITAINPGSFYIECMINTNYCNDSPIFTSLPTPYFCAGQPYNYNHGASDPEGDTLYYAQTCPLEGQNVCATYNAGYSVNQPLLTSPANTFGFNQFTGQMSFTPQNGTAQVGVGAVTVFNVVNGDTIGYVMRDIQMIVLNTVNCTSPVGTNDPLVLGGGLYDTLSNTFVICAGDTLQFQINMTDPDGDTIDILAANTNLTQVFGAANWQIFKQKLGPFPGRPDSVRFSIQIIAQPNLIGANQFTIGVTDGACPIPGDQILGYNLVIPGVEVTASDTTICPGIGQQIQMNANAFTTVGNSIDGSYSWSQTSGPSITFSDDTIPNPFVNVPSSVVDGDSIVLQVTYTTVPDPTTGSQCVTTDEVVVYIRTLPLDLTILATDTTLCPNSLTETVSFSTNVIGPGVDLVNGTYNWTASPTNYLDSLTSGNVNNPDANISGSYGDSVTYSVSYTYGACSGASNVTLRFDQATLTTAGDTSICPGDTVQISGNFNSIVVGSSGTCGLNASATCNGPTTQQVVGTNTTTHNFPYRGFWEDGRVQMLYRASELLAAGVQPGLLTEAAFNITSLGSGQPFSNFTIRIGCTSLNQMTYGGFGSPFVAGPVQVYTGSANTVLGWNTYSFATPYEWDGVSNLIVEVCFDNNSWTNDDRVQAENTPFQSVLEFETDGVAGCVANPERDGNIRPVIRFGNCGTAPPYSFQWTPPVGFPSGGDTLDVVDVTPNASVTYIFTADDGDCVLYDSVEMSVLSTIPPPTVSCGTPANQATSVLFEWGQSPGATGWEYSLDSGLTWIPRPYQDSSLLVSGLTNGDCAIILVRAVGGAGPCPTNAATYLQCCTTPCPPVNNAIGTDLSCNNAANGMIDLALTGGVLGTHPDFNVTLFDTSGAQVGSPVNALDTATFSGLDAGMYYMYVIDTLGCFTYTDTVTLTQPDSLMLELDSTTLTTCYSSSDGTGTVMAVGGTPGYNYQWDAAAGSQTTQTVVGLPVGTYNVVMTDNNGCTDTLGVDIQSYFPAPPAITLTTTANTSCTGNGSATVFTTTNMVGNANNFTYQWSGSPSATPTATGLQAGAHTVTVTDENGCTATNSFTISGNPSLAIASIVPIQPGCNQNNGQATAVASGDSVGYNYQWTDGQTTALATGLGVGTHVVTVTGMSNGCTATDSITLTNTNGVQIVGFNVANPSCGGSNGTTQVFTANAAGAVSYQWDVNASSQTTQTATGLPIGTYSVTVTDAAGCVDIGDTTLTQETITASISSSNDPTCNLSNGDMTVSVAGAPGPFTYQWSNGATDAVALGLGAGTYTVTATYQGCTATATGSLSSQSLSISIFDKDDIICNGDLSSYAYVSANASSSVTYAWSGPNGFTSSNDSISGLAAGTYTVTASVGSGCSVTQSISVVDIALTVDPWIINYGQTGAVIQLNDIVNISGGVSTNHFNPTFSWTADTTSSVTINNPSDSATTVEGTGSGTTLLTFTANAGPCSATGTITVEVQSYQGMPTAFTPNGDGINDFFRPTGLNNYAKVRQFKIWNRWGQLLYDDASNPQWDGTHNGVPQPRDVYIYVFEYETDNGDNILIRGEFTLIR